MERHSLFSDHIIGKLAVFISVMFALFHLYTSAVGPYTAVLQRSAHLSFALILGFLIWGVNGKNKTKSWADVLLATLAAISTLYLVINYKSVIRRINAVDFNMADYIFGVITIILVLELTRRTVGRALVFLAVISLIYAYVGPHLPGLFAHRGYGWERIVSHTYLTTEGLFGTPLAASATFVVTFLIFGAFLEAFGGGKIFIDLGNVVAGRARGGPAKVAIVSSSFMGTISGSALANVATTGVFTIPLMKKMGYRPHVAGAVESVASTGGMIMPPIMGIVAFIMAEFTGISYTTIIISATIPAILYFTSLFVMTHIEAVKLGIKGLPRDQIPDFRKTMIQALYLVIPLGVLVTLMLKGYSPMISAFASIVLLVICAVIRDRKLDWRVVIRALDNAGKMVVPIAAACAVAGILIGMFTLTGIGLKFSVIMTNLSQGIPFLLLILIAVTCVVLGMGLPASAAYILTAALGAPALIEMGFPLLESHLFILYFANLSNITPPIAMAAFTAAGIAESNPMETAFQAVKLGIVAFIVPFMFMYGPSLLLQGTMIEIMLTTFTALVGVVALGGGMQRFLLKPCSIIESIVLLSAGLVMIMPGIFTDALGILLFSVVIGRQVFELKKK